MWLIPLKKVLVLKPLTVALPTELERQNLVFNGKVRNFCSHFKKVAKFNFQGGSSGFPSDDGI
jgi:hypothetical protein